MKNLLLGVFLVIVAVSVFNAMNSTHVIMIDGHHFDHSHVIEGGFGALLSAIIGFGVAVLLAFIFVGVGIFVVGVFMFVGVVVFVALFPMFLPLIIPLAIIWLIIAAFRTKESNSKKQLPNPPVNQ